MKLRFTIEYISEFDKFLLSVKKEIYFCIIMSKITVIQYIWNTTTTGRQVFKGLENKHNWIIQ